MPPITLNIDFVGLCLYVDEPSQTAPRLHVLLLAPDLDPGAMSSVGHGGGHGQHAISRHHPRIFYDSAYDTPDSTGLSGSFNSIALDDKALDLSRFGGILDASFGSVPDLTAVTGKKIARKRIGPAPGNLISARVSLASGSGTPTIAEGPWELGPIKETAIAHKLRWTMDIDSAQLSKGALAWELKGLNKRGGQPLRPLYPVGGTIDLWVMNVVRDELFPADKPGDPPQNGEPMAHFAPFYAALKSPAPGPLPIWRGPDGPGGPIGKNYDCGEARATVG